MEAGEHRAENITASVADIDSGVERHVNYSMFPWYRMAVEKYFRWKKEKPVEQINRKKGAGKISRREFLKAVAVSGGVAIGGSLLAGCGSSSGGLTLDLTKPENQALAAVGGTLALDATSLDSQGILLYRSSDTSVLAFSRKCTHLGCAVGDFQNGVSTCPCHGSQYDTGGNVVRGPSQAPLRRYTAALSGSIVTIKAA
jgi:cytochrome b6-f complex iron-sulfur subunit